MKKTPSITFKETLSHSEIDSLFDELIHNRVKVQAPNKTNFIITDIEKEKVFTDLSDLPPYAQNALVLELKLHDVKYEFSTELKSSKGKVYLIRPKTVFKFQRRENYRTAIPKNLNFNLKAVINGQAIKTIRIINISLTGALFALKGYDGLDFQDSFSSELSYEDQSFNIEGDIVRIDLQSDELFFAIQYNTKMAAHKAALHQFLLHCFRISKSLT